MTFIDSMTVAYCCLSYPTYPFLAFSEIVSEICMRCSAADAASDRPRRWSTMARALNFRFTAEILRQQKQPQPLHLQRCRMIRTHFKNLQNRSNERPRSPWQRFWPPGYLSQSNILRMSPKVALHEVKWTTMTQCQRHINGYRRV